MPARPPTAGFDALYGVETPTGVSVTNVVLNHDFGELAYRLTIEARIDGRFWAARRPVPANDYGMGAVAGEVLNPMFVSTFGEQAIEIMQSLAKVDLEGLPKELRSLVVKAQRLVIDDTKRRLGGK